MPYRVLLSKKEGLGVVELSGEVDWGDLGAAMRTLYGHPDWEPGFSTLWDARAITSFHVFPEDFPAVQASFEAAARARGEGGASAIAAREGDEALWVLFPKLGPPTRRRVGVFTQLEEALAFVGRAALPENAALVATSDGS